MIDMDENEIIYLDNAATTWPKPPETMRAMVEFNKFVGANPGRSGHRLSIEAGRTLFQTRENIASLLGIKNPLQIIFTKNATEALNIAILGLLNPGDHIITSGVEHNSVMRPLRYLEKQGLELSLLKTSGDGDIDPRDIIPHIKKNTRAIIITGVSNVTGSIMPVKEIGTIAREHNLFYCVDAAQSAGAVPVLVDDINIDLMAFTGHKSLLGPQGTGGLYIREGVDKALTPQIFGGTGSRSEFEEQPDFIPDKFESGTPNTIGFAGLGAGVAFLLATGINKIRTHEEIICKLFIDGLKSIRGITLYGTSEIKKRVPIFSFNINGVSPSDAALVFDEKFNIMSRPGLHCAPAAHRTIGTFPAGTNRFSFGFFNTSEDVYKALGAIDYMATRKMK